MGMTKTSKHLGINRLTGRYKLLRTSLYSINTDAVSKNTVGVSVNSDGVSTNSVDTLKRYTASPLFIVK